MASVYSAGAAIVRILPSLLGFKQEVEEQLRKQFRDGINVPVDPQVQGDAAGEGAVYGGAFGRSLKRALDLAIDDIPDIEIDANSTPAERKVAELRARMEALRDKRVGIDIDGDSAMREAVAINRELDALSRNRNVDVGIRTNAGAAAAEMAVFSSQVDALNGKTVQIDADTSRARANVNALLLAISALGPAIIPVAAGATAAFAGLGAAMLPAIAGIGGATLAFGGVGDAISAAGEAATATGQKATQSAAQQLSSANSVLSAQESLQDAVRRVGVAQENATRQVQQALRQERDARQGVAEASRQAAEANIAAQQRQQDAVRTLTRAIRDERQAQLDLISARQRAAEQLEDLRSRTQNVALSQRGAQLGLRRALMELEDARNEDDDGEEARLRIDEAELAVDRARQQIKDLGTDARRSNADLAQANRNGINGSNLVRQAEDRVRDATEARADALRNLVEANREAVSTQLDGNRRVEAAEQRLADASDNVTRARVDGARSVADAQRAVEGAARSLAVAQAQAVEAMKPAAAEADKYAEAMAKLLPVQREFVEFYLSQLKPKFDEMKRVAAEGLFPGLTDGLRNAMPFLDRLNTLVGTSTTSFGNLARTAGAALSGPFWSQFMDFLNSIADETITGFFTGLGNFLKGIAGLSQAAYPIFRDMGTYLGGLMEQFAKFGEDAAAGKSESFNSFLRYVRENGPVIREFFENLFRAVGNILRSLAGPGAIALGILADVLGFIAELPPPVIQGLIGLFLAIGAMKFLNNQLADGRALLGTIRDIGGGVGNLRDRIKALGKGQIKEALLGADGCTSTRACIGETADLMGDGRGKQRGIAARLRDIKNFNGLSGVLFGSLGVAGIVAGVSAIAYQIWSMIPQDKAPAQTFGRNNDLSKSYGQRQMGNTGQFVQGGAMVGTGLFDSWFGATPEAKAEGSRTMKRGALSGAAGTAGFFGNIMIEFNQLKIDLAKGWDDLKKTTKTKAFAVYDTALSYFDERGLKGWVIRKVADIGIWWTRWWETLKTTVRQKAFSVYDTVLSYFDERGLKGWVIRKIADIGAWWSRWWDDVKLWVRTKAFGVYDTVMSYFDERGLKGWVMRKIFDLGMWWSRWWDDAKLWVRTKAFGVYDTVMSYFDERGLKGWVMRKIFDLGMWWSGWWDGTKKMVRDKAYSVYDTVLSYFDERGLKGWVTRAMVDLAINLAGTWTNIVEMARNTWARIKGVVADPINFVTQVVYGIHIRDAWGRIQSWIPGLPNLPEAPQPIRYASGGTPRGRVNGPGTRTSDSIPSYLSFDEHVLTGDEVEAFGGHNAVYAMRKAAMQGKFRPRFAGGGMPWQELWGIVSRQFPTATLNSAYAGRENDPGFHGKGLAVDVGGPMMAINQWLAGAFPNSTELIYTPGVNIDNGRPHVFDAQTQADHYDHVHWVGPGAGGGFLGGLLGGLMDPIGWLRDQFKGAFDAMLGIDQRPQGWPTFARAIPGKIVDGLVNFAKDKIPFMGGGGGGNVEQWRGVVMQALGMLGQNPGLVGSTLRRMDQESGGDPDVVNRWDINWLKGTPSVGLMQVIGPTYRSNADPRHNIGPYLYGTSIDPLSNILASMRYALREYGSLPAAYDKRGGYDSGGWLQPGYTMAWNGTGKPEAVFTAEQFGTIRQAMAAGLQARAGGGGTALHIHGDVNRPVDVDTIMQRMSFEQRKVRF